MTPREHEEEDEYHGLWGDEEESEEGINRIDSEEELPFDERIALAFHNLEHDHGMPQRRDVAREFAQTALAQLVSERNINLPKQQRLEDESSTEERQDAPTRDCRENPGLSETETQPDTTSTVLDYHVKKALHKIKTTIEEHTRTLQNYNSPDRKQPSSKELETLSPWPRSFLPDRTPPRSSLSSPLPK